MATHKNHAQRDLAGYITHAHVSGEAYADPYGHAIAVIGTTLAWALDDNVVNGMSPQEQQILLDMGQVLARYDRVSYVQYLDGEASSF